MAPRIDLYSLPHKSLRHALHEGGAALGAGDPGPAREALVALAAHGGHEDDFIGPLLARHVPDLHLAVAGQHAELDGLLDVNHALLEGDDLVAAYRSFHRLVAWNLRHFDEEETVVLPALQAAVPDEVLEEVLVAFRAAHPDADAIYARWPAPLTATERRLVGVD